MIAAAHAPMGLILIEVSIEAWKGLAGGRGELFLPPAKDKPRMSVSLLFTPATYQSERGPSLSASPCPPCRGTRF